MFPVCARDLAFLLGLSPAGSALHSNPATSAFKPFYSSERASLPFLFCWERETNEEMWVITSNFPLQTEGLQAVTLR